MDLRRRVCDFPILGGGLSFDELGDLLKRGVMNSFRIFCFPFRHSCEIIGNEGMIESSGFTPDSLGAMLFASDEDISSPRCGDSSDAC